MGPAAATGITRNDDILTISHREDGTGEAGDDRLRRLAQVGAAVAAAGRDPDAVLAVLTDRLADLPADAVTVWLAEPGGTLVGWPPGADEPTAATGAVAEVARTARAVEFRADGGEAVLISPVCGSRGPVGVVALSRRSAQRFDGAERAAVMVIGRRVGAAFEVALLASRLGQQDELVEAVSDAVIAVDSFGRVRSWNRAAARIYGICAEEARGRAFSDLVPLTQHLDGDEQDMHRRLHVSGAWRGLLRQTSRSGTSVEVESSVSLRHGARGERDGLVLVNRDLTEVLAVRASAQRQARFTDELMNALDGAAAVLDDAGRVIASNARWQEGLLADRARCVCGPVHDGQNWWAGIEPLDEEGRAFLEAAGQVLAGRRALAQLECRCDAAGPEVATAIDVVGLNGPHVGALVVQSDVSWRRRMQEQLTHRATHDELTGLPNRPALVERMAAGLERLDGQRMLAVLFCDLDGFKDVNDAFGHAVGDQVLVAVARRLRQRCRSADVVARFGGDEFVVVLSVPDPEQAVAMADRIVEMLTEPIVVGRIEVATGVSVGIRLIDALPGGDDPVGTLMRDADTAMYHAKGRGRGRHEVFDDSLRENLAERVEITAALNRAITEESLQVVYQARRYCGDRRIAGVEALLQWHHPQLGDVTPSVFIPIAERTGRIVELGGWVLRRALGEIAAVADRRISVAVNVSARQLTTPRLAGTVAEALAATGLEPHRLVLEITESALLVDPDAARAALGELRELGVSIALDDFGTGWSSLSYLRTLPVDIIKIDRSFVADMHTDPDACAVVSAVLGLGHGMGLVVVAEGVESAGQLTMLREMGCDEYQGFLDGPPGGLPQVLALHPEAG